jgi:2-dehydro-3-deoxygalactonokinase
MARANMPESDARCIGIDWGTTRLRAYLIAGSGEILARHTSDAGVASARGEFERIFTRELGGWLEAHPDASVVASGMAGSRQGWVETRYLPCPVDLSALAHGLELRRIGERRVAFTPGVTRVARDGMPDVMRGEEIQVLGSLETQGDGWCVLPGTHSKWVLVEAGRIVWFATFMSGELFDVLVQHSVLTRGKEPPERIAPEGSAAFQRGVDYALETETESGGFLKRLFSTRSLVARGELTTPDAREYLSGLIIGGELREALASLPGPAPRRVLLLGSDELSRRYATAFERSGIPTVKGDVDAAATGHLIVARQAGLL